MHVLLVTVGTAGDLLPFVALGKALRSRGHKVTILGNGYFRETAEREALSFVEVCSAGEHVERTRQRNRWTYFQAFREGAQNLLKDMPKVYDAVAANHVPGETVVAAAGLMFGARIAQEKLGFPLATVHLYPFCFRSVHDPAAWPRWIPLSARHGYYWLLDRLIDRHLGVGINAFRMRLRLPPATRLLGKWWHSPQRVLGFFPEWLSRPQADWPPNTLLTGFPLYDALKPFPAERELDEFLASGPPPLVFSHSSAVFDARRFFAASAAVAQALGRRAVLLTPHSDQVPPLRSPEFRHFSFVPHSCLLPRAAALVHHGGIGTAFQALTAGIPQLIAPIFLDQPDNGRRFTRLGVADAVRPGTYRPEEVARKLERLLQSDDVAARCREYAARCGQTNAAESACAALEQLFAMLGGKTAVSKAEVSKTDGGCQRTFAGAVHR